jgi:hypothetical protein
MTFHYIHYNIIKTLCCMYINQQSIQKMHVIIILLNNPNLLHLDENLSKKIQNIIFFKGTSISSSHNVFTKPFS